jgi:DNA-binding transcriptional regulator GbsR (MarR family)
MSFTKSLMSQGMKMMQDPRVVKLLQDPRLMTAMAKGFEIKGKVQQEFDAQAEKLADRLNFATKAEVRELKRTIRKLERELSKKGAA